MIPSVLLVDDDVELVGLLADYLRRDGFATTLAHDGATAIAEALGGRHDIVMLDAWERIRRDAVDEVASALVYGRRICVYSKRRGLCRPHGSRDRDGRLGGAIRGGLRWDTAIPPAVLYGPHRSLRRIPRGVLPPPSMNIV